jgi:hypothetical protein
LIKIPCIRAGGVAKVVEWVPSKCEALSSNPITAKKENNRIIPHITIIEQVTQCTSHVELTQWKVRASIEGRKPHVVREKAGKANFNALNSKIEVFSLCSPVRPF